MPPCVAAGHSDRRGLHRVVSGTTPLRALHAKAVATTGIEWPRGAPLYRASRR